MKLRSNKLDAMTFNSIADLKSFPSSRFSDGAVANVLGYYAPGDGGGGEFVLDLASVAADNGGTVIAPDAGSGRWERVWDKQAVNVLWFGAVGNTQHTPTFSGADPRTGNPADYVEPVGNDDTNAFVRAFLCCENVVAPETGAWYKIKARIGNEAVSDYVVIPDGGSLSGGGKIFIATRYNEMNFSGADPVPSGLSRGILIKGDCNVTNMTFDGGSQYTPIDAALNQFVWFITMGPGDVVNTKPSLSSFTDCRFYNATGSHITGTLASNRLNSVEATGCLFTDYGDHCFYFSQIEGAVFSNNVIRANKTTTVRDAVKGRTLARSYIVSNNFAEIPNGIFCYPSSESGQETGKWIISNNVINSDEGVICDDVSYLKITNNIFNTSGYFFICGGFSTGQNCDFIELSNNIIPIGLGMVVTGGTANAARTVSSSDYLNKKIGTFVFNDNVVGDSAISPSLVFIGTIENLSMQRNKISVATGLINRFDRVVGDSGRWVISDNEFIRNPSTLIDTGGLSIVAGVTTWPVNLRMRNNRVFRSTSSYVGGANSSLFTGVIYPEGNRLIGFSTEPSLVPDSSFGSGRIIYDSEFREYSSERIAGQGLVYSPPRTLELSSQGAITVADSAALRPGLDDFSFAMWTSFPILSAGGSKCLIRKGGRFVAGFTANSWILGTRGTSNLLTYREHFGVNTNDWNEVTFRAPNGICHLAVVRSGTTVTIYINGSKAASYYMPKTDMDNTAAFSVSANSASEWSNTAYGDIGYWVDYALTENDVFRVMQYGPASVATGLQVALSSNDANPQSNAWINSAGADAAITASSATWKATAPDGGYLQGTATPVGAVTPRWIGDNFLNTTGPTWFKSTGLTTADWVALN